MAYGPSAHHPDGYFLIRAFKSLEEREAREESFYSSDAWRKGPREAIIGHIETYTDAVLWLGDSALAELRKSLAPPQ